MDDWLSEIETGISTALCSDGSGIYICVDCGMAIGENEGCQNCQIERMARVLRELAGIVKLINPENDRIELIRAMNILSDDAVDICVAAREQSRE